MLLETETINISEVIFETINSLFQNLFSSIDNSLYPILDDITFVGTDILKNSFLEKILGSSTENGIILICNSLLIGFIIYYGITLLFSYFTYSDVQRPLSFIFKLIIFGILLNFSYFICEQIILINEYICLAIRGLGEDLFNKSICFSGLIESLNSSISIRRN